jgi:hypothetical protein
LNYFGLSLGLFAKSSRLDIPEETVTQKQRAWTERRRDMFSVQSSGRIPGFLEDEF